MHIYYEKILTDVKMHNPYFIYCTNMVYLVQ